MSKIEDWGNTTWYLFHSIAEKITDEIFNQERKNIIGMIRKICTVLPCPDCAEHATEYFKKVNFDLIKDRYSLKSFLFDFHNKVNLRTNKKLFTREELESKYKKANLKIIINYFMKFFFANTNNPKMYTHSFQRDMIKVKLNQYLNSLELKISHANSNNP